MTKIVSLMDSGEKTLLSFQAKRNIESPALSYDNQDQTDLISDINGTTFSPETSVFLIVLRDAYLCLGPGVDGMIYTNAGELLHETTFFTDPPEELTTEMLKSRAISIDESMLTGVDAGWKNYYHWMIYGIGKPGLVLPYLEDSWTVSCPDYRSASRHAWGLKFSLPVWEQSLRLLGRPEKLKVLPDGIFKVKRLGIVWANHNRPPFITFSDSFYNLFREFSKKHVCKSEVFPSKMMIERRENPRIDSESYQKLKSVASQRGFESVFLEDYDFNEQVCIIKNAEKIISTHGAGLTNLLFARPGASVLELNSFLDGENQLRPWFYLISRGIGLNYTYLNGDLGGFSMDNLESAISSL